MIIKLSDLTYLPSIPKGKLILVRHNIGEYILKKIDSQAAVYNPPFPYSIVECNNDLYCGLGNGCVLSISKAFKVKSCAALHEIGIADLCINKQLLFSVDNLGRLVISSVGDLSIKNSLKVSEKVNNKTGKCITMLISHNGSLHCRCNAEY